MQKQKKSKVTQMKVIFNEGKDGVGKVNIPCVVAWEVEDKLPFKIEHIAVTCGCTNVVYDRTPSNKHTITATVTKHSPTEYSTNLTLSYKYDGTKDILKTTLPLKIKFS